MVRQLKLLVLVLVAAMGSSRVLADDGRFAIRFGLVNLERPEDTEGHAGGVQFDFEWYFQKRWGLESSVALVALPTALDLMIPVTVGLNRHVVRTRRFDWSLGVLAGRVFYVLPNFNTGSTTTYDGSAYGAQTSLDIGVTKRGRWGINLGLKLLKTRTSDDSPDGKFVYDPIAFRVMGLHRW